MSLLSAQLTNAYFGTGVWEVVLQKNGKHVASVVPDWKIGENSATAALFFVFEKYTTFDELVVYRNGETQAMGERYERAVALPPGAEWSHQIEVVLTEEI